MLFKLMYINCHTHNLCGHIKLVHDIEERSAEAESSSRAVESVKQPRELFFIIENDGEN